MTTSIGGTTGVTFPDLSVQPIAAGSYTMGFKNRIINGAMIIDQKNEGAEITPANTDYIVDRWFASLTAASKYKAGQNAGAVTPPTGFIDYLGATSLSSYTVGASDSFSLRQSIEGLNMADLAWGTASAATITLSFWVRSTGLATYPATFGASLKNSGSTRSYPFTYTINTAATWEQKTVTIAGDTTGTWLTTNGVGVTLCFSLGSGSTYSGTADTWASANYISVAGAASVVGTSGATFYITGVQFEKGSTATSFDVRPYGTELMLCQRYYYKVSASNGILAESGYATSATGFRGVTKFPVTMRTAPTALGQTGTATNYRVIGSGAASTVCSTVPVFTNATENMAQTTFTVASGLTAYSGGTGASSGTTAYLGWDAEL